MHIIKAKSRSLLRACRGFLAQDLTTNVLPLGDLYSPLLRISDIYSAIQDNQVIGVCTTYRAFSTPSVVYGATTREVKQALLKKAMTEISDEFTSICQPKDIDLFREEASILHLHFEQQMIADPPKPIDYGSILVERISKNGLGLLNDFYVEHHAKAWIPIQFKAGPYYCVKRGGKIVSAAGVHLVTPHVAQLGNIITDYAHRNRGFATACTNVLARDLASKGRIISLFVRTNNAPALRVYEKTGFHKIREIVFLALQKNQISKEKEKKR